MFFFSIQINMILPLNLTKIYISPIITVKEMKLQWDMFVDKKTENRERTIYVWIKKVNFLEIASSYWVIFKHYHWLQAFKVHCMFKNRSTNGGIIPWYLLQTKAIKERNQKEEVENQRKTQYVILKRRKTFLFKLCHFLFIIWSSHFFCKTPVY